MNPRGKERGIEQFDSAVDDENESDENADYREYPAEPRV